MLVGPTLLIEKWQPATASSFPFSIFHTTSFSFSRRITQQLPVRRIFGAVVGYLCNLIWGHNFCNTMNLGFLGNIPWVKAQLNTDSVTDLVPTQAKQESSGNDPKLSGWHLSFLSLFPWANSGAVDKFQRPTTINKELKRHAQKTSGNVVGKDSGAAATPLRFRPYVCKVPWHTGVRAFLSQLFPRYGHYCGPNWSSGKDKGSLVWDRRPIDWLDFCCYCHDIGYDTHDQAKLLKADLAFLECLEKQNIMSTKGDPNVAHLYKTMCINGLKNFLIPYRTHLVNLQQSGQPLIQFGWLSNLRWRSWNFQKT